MISLRAKLEIGAVVLAIVAAAFGFRTWLEEHDDRIRAQQDIQAQQKVFDQAQTNLQQLRAQDQARAADTEKRVQQLEQTAAKAVTPEQIAGFFRQSASGLPQPITVQIPAPTAQNPSPAATASIPAADLAPLRDQIEKCQECSLKLSSAQQDVTSRDAQLTAAGQELSAVSKERDDLKTELKGGTFKQRLKRGAKPIVCAVAGAAIGAALDSKNPSAGSGAGAAIGGVGCALF